MPIPVTSKQYPILDEDVYVGLCVAVIDLGTQPSRDYGPSRNVMFEFEFPDNLRDDGRPHKVSQTATFSLGEKAKLRKFLKSWRGVDLTPDQLKAGFDVGQMLGIAARITIEHNTGKEGRTYANIGSIKPHKGKTPYTESDLIEFSIDEATDIPRSLAPYIQEKIRQSAEWRERSAPAPQRSLAPSAPIDHDFDETNPDSDDSPF